MNRPVSYVCGTSDHPLVYQTIGTAFDRALIFVSVLMLFVALNAALEGTTFASGMPIISRFTLIAAAVLLAWPNHYLRTAGLVLVLGILFLEYRRSRPRGTQQLAA